MLERGLTSPSDLSDDVQVIIVTSSLMKDMNSKMDLYRANAIRVLCRITDGGLLGQIERYIKQALVDKNPVVASAALVSGIHLLQVSLSIGSVKYTHILLVMLSQADNHASRFIILMP